MTSKFFLMYIIINQCLNLTYRPNKHKKVKSISTIIFNNQILRKIKINRDIEPPLSIFLKTKPLLSPNNHFQKLINNNIYHAFLYLETLKIK